MSTNSYAIRDSATMLRRNLLHALRYPGMTLGVLLIPVLMLLLFRYVFGATLGAGIGARTGGYINYLAPGIIVLAVSSASVSTAVAVNMDMTEGIINRFRTMAIARVSVLTGHVLANLVQAMASIAIVLGVAAALGFRPHASAIQWLAAIGLLLLFSLALVWLATALGLAAKSVETASNTPMFLYLLPFLSSSFVPASSMPAGLRQFAEYQPYTPLTETVRGLIAGTPIGAAHAIAAVAWSAGIAAASYLWARHLYNHRSAR